MPPSEHQTESLAAKLARLEHQEYRLWRISLLFLALLATGLAAASWQNFSLIPQHLQAVPIGTVVLGVLFALYVGAKRREIAELKGMVLGMEQGVGVSPSDKQLAHLLDAISNSQRGFRDLIDSFEEPVLSLSLDGTIRTLNRAAADLLGKPFPELVGRRLDELVAEPAREEVERGRDRFLERRHWSGVVRLRLKKGGAVRYLDCMLHPLLQEGAVAGVSILARDITQERDRESRFTELFETLQEGVYFTTPGGVMLDCNMALVRMLGYDSKQEILAVDTRQLYFDPADRAGVLREMEESGSMRTREVVLRRKDGNPIIVLNTGRAVSDGSGRVVRYQGAFIDVTQQRQMEQRLHAQEEFRRRLVESFPDLVLALDCEGRYTFVSPRVREVLGYEPEALLGRSILHAETPAHAPELVELYRRLVNGQELLDSTEFAARHLDGGWKTLRANASPMYDAEGRLAGVVASLRDVTTLKQLEQQLIQTDRLAAMGQMIDGFAHELNNPLTAILGSIELLQASTSDAGMARKLEMMKQQSKRAAEIVQNLLFFSRPPAPGRAQLSLSDLVQRSLQLHEHSLRVNSIALDFIPESGLPPVLGDPNQLMQVFLNLVINAEQAIREVRPRGTLRVRLGQGEGRVWASFQDDGPGIPPELAARIFDPFFTTKRPGRGTGLGLSVCLAILKKYDGEIQVQPGPGGGSVFTVYLPVRPDSPARAKPGAAASALTH
jgi:PAS domain S-box-containing protein